ncbi:MAG TPA: mechanosensitive ion channel family protein [Candidatus Dormibacteraeota bacterium]|nr:mechanosensitive ion channel family protein [Candidatus Dormibacteraeota bacterium]
MRAYIRLFTCGVALALTALLLPLAPANAGQKVNSAATGQTAKTLAANPAAPPQKGGSAETGAPVVVSGKTIFTVRESLFTFSPQQRAQAIVDRVEWLSKQPENRILTVRTENEGSFTVILSGETVLATVTDADASVAGKDRHELAEDYAGQIRAAAESLQREFGLKAILLSALYAMLATAALVLLLKLFGVAFPKLYEKLHAWHGVYIRSVRIQKLELLPAERITAVLRFLARAVRVVLTLVLLYAYVTLTFSFFPWTQGFSSSLLRSLLWPVRVVVSAALAYAPNVLFIVVILAAAYYLIKFVKVFFVAVARRSITLPDFYPEWAMPTYRISRFLVIAFTAVIIFPYLPGSSSPAFRGVSIFLGLLFSLGSSSAIANVVAGTVLTYTRAFHVGDRVKIADSTGDVIEKTLLSTRIRTIKNEEISIPNALVLGNHVTNYSSAARDRGLVLYTGVTIGYDAPWRIVHELLIDAALASANIQKNPRPFVLQTALNDFYVSYQINAFTDRPADMAQTYSELHQNIQDKFNEAGVEIMSQHFTGIRDGNQTTIPGEYRAKDYVAPSFRIPMREVVRAGNDNDPVGA